MVYRCLETFRFCFFPCENVCQPSSFQCKLRSIKTRLNWLQTVIDGQKNRRNPGRNVENPTDLDWTRALGPQTEPCLRTACAGAEVTLQTNTECGSVVRDVPFAYTTFLDTLLE